MERLLRYLGAALALAAYSLPACAQTSPEKAVAFLLAACFETAPTFARTEAIVLAAGGQAFDDPTFLERQAPLEDGRIIGQWTAPEPDPKDWTLMVGEGRLGNLRARECFDILPAEPEKVAAAIGARWKLKKIGSPHADLFGSARQDFSAVVHGVEALIVIKSFRGIGRPAMVTVVFLSSPPERADDGLSQRRVQENRSG
jgi:hypothetical protein